jgi:glycosyltransferase involved in cell wall biosynthesis
MGRCNPESANGIDKMVFHLSRAQAALGHAVAVFSLTGKPAIAIPGVQVATYRPVSITIGSERARDLLVGRSPLNLSSALVSDLLAWRPDILHLHFVHVPQNLVLAHHARRVGIPYCVSIHGGLAPRALARRRWSKRVFNALFEQRYLNRAAFVHALGPEDHDGLEECGVHNRIIDAPNGIDLASLPTPADRGALAELAPALRGKRVFAFVGRLDPQQKGLDLLVHALARLERDDIALALIGTDWREQRAVLEALARQLGVADRVIFTGPAFGQRKADLLGGADVFVHPSRWEGFPLSVLEAAGSGLPSLLSHAADPADAFSTGAASITVDPIVDGIRAGLSRFADMEPDALRAMGERARRVVESRFGWPPIAQAFVDAYQAYAWSRR